MSKPEKSNPKAEVAAVVLPDLKSAPFRLMYANHDATVIAVRPDGLGLMVTYPAFKTEENAAGEKVKTVAYLRTFPQLGLDAIAKVQTEPAAVIAAMLEASHGNATLLLDAFNHGTRIRELAPDSELAAFSEAERAILLAAEKLQKGTRAAILALPLDAARERLNAVKTSLIALGIPIEPAPESESATAEEAAA